MAGAAAVSAVTSAAAVSSPSCPRVSPRVTVSRVTGHRVTVCHGSGQSPDTAWSHHVSLEGTPHCTDRRVAHRHLTNTQDPAEMAVFRCLGSPHADWACCRRYRSRRARRRLSLITASRSRRFFSEARPGDAGGLIPSVFRARIRPDPHTRSRAPLAAGGLTVQELSQQTGREARTAHAAEFIEIRG